MNSRNQLLVELGTSALAVLLLLSYLIWSGYQERIRTAETTTRNYAAIIEARLDASLRSADAELRDLVRTIPVAALSKDAVSNRIPVVISAPRSGFSGSCSKNINICEFGKPLCSM